MLLIDFCNIKEWSIESISNLYEYHKIVHSQYGEQRGWETCCQTRKSKRLYYFIEEGILEPHEDMPEEDKKRFKWFSVLSTDPDFSELWEFLRKSQMHYKTFLDRCVNGQLDVNFVNDLLVEKPFRFEQNSQDKWRLQINYTQLYLADLESYIDWEIIRSNIYPDKRSIFGRLKICEWCGNYFVYDRKTKRFCRTKCQQDFNYRKGMDSGERQKYMRKWRKENPENI
jgi:hypothetical protein